MRDELGSERESLVRYYESMTPEKRRERILLQPAYRDAYNEITEAHQRVELPRYFWRRWVPLLGPTASVVYMRLRDASFSHTEGAGLCGIAQDELARDVGISDRKVIRRALQTLEDHGFIARTKCYGEPNPRTGRVLRLADRITVFFEIPLHTEDAVELLIRESRQAVIDCPGMGEIPSYGNPVREENDHTGETPQVIEKARYGPFSPSKRLEPNGNYRSSSKTVVDSPAPHVPIVEDLIEALDDPSSSRFYHLVASRMPETVIRRLISETKSARLEGRLRDRAGAYFTAAVKREALELGISLKARRS